MGSPYTLRKRSPPPAGESTLLPALKPPQDVATAAVAPLAGAAPVLKGIPASKEGRIDDESRLEWYAVADEYWKEYLNDLARKTVIEKMVRDDYNEFILLSFAPSRPSST